MPPEMQPAPAGMESVLKAFADDIEANVNGVGQDEKSEENLAQKREMIGRADQM